MTCVYHAAKHRKSPRLLALARELKKNYLIMVTHTTDFVKSQIYPAKHRKIWIDWEAPATDSQRLMCAVITGLMLGYFLFSSMCK